MFKEATGHPNDPWLITRAPHSTSAGEANTKITRNIGGFERTSDEETTCRNRRMSVSTLRAWIYDSGTIGVSSTSTNSTPYATYDTTYTFWS